MSRQPETGESSASIVRRGDEEAWRRAEPILQAGGTLVRVPMLNLYATDDGTGNAIGQVTISPAGVRRLERQGVLRFVGVERYGLTIIDREKGTDA